MGQQPTFNLSQCLCEVDCDYNGQSLFRSRENWKTQGKSENFPVTRKSWNIDYSPVVREFENSWVENQKKAAHNLFEGEKKGTEIL